MLSAVLRAGRSLTAGLSCLSTADSILMSYQNFNPAVSSEFNNNCVAACSVTTCSCTAAGFYWSSTTGAANSSYAWAVDFGNGDVGAGAEGLAFRVRAVRGAQ